MGAVMAAITRGRQTLLKEPDMLCEHMCFGVFRMQAAVQMHDQFSNLSI